MKTETPRTDELDKKQHNHICGSSNDPADLLGAACNEMADLCREIERENEKLKQLGKKLAHYVKAARNGDSPLIQAAIVESIDDALKQWSDFLSNKQIEPPHENPSK